jgi:hypothetical protein
MFDDTLLTKANLELTRLSRELHALHQEEERCKIRRSRLENDRIRVQSLVDMCELAQRLDAKPLPPRPNPDYHLEDCHGAKLVIVDKPGAPQPTQRRRPEKPAGLPSIANMIMTVVKQKGVPEEGLAPREIASFIRQAWWPEVKPRCIHGTAWGLVQKGLLEKDGHRYRLNGHAGE